MHLQRQKFWSVRIVLFLYMTISRPKKERHGPPPTNSDIINNNSVDFRADPHLP